MAGNCSSPGVGTTPGCSSIADSPDDAFGERPVCASADSVMRPKAAVLTASSHAALHLHRTNDRIRGLFGVCFSSNASIGLKIAAPTFIFTIVEAHLFRPMSPVRRASLANLGPFYRRTGVRQKR